MAINPIVAEKLKAAEEFSKLLRECPRFAGGVFGALFDASMPPSMAGKLIEDLMSLDGAIEHLEQQCPASSAL